MSEDPLDRPATPEEIEMVERLLTRTRPAEQCGSATERGIADRSSPT